MRGKEVMRIVLIGVSHWHTPFYSDPVLGALLLEWPEQPYVRFWRPQAVRTLRLGAVRFPLAGGRGRQIFRDRGWTPGRHSSTRRTGERPR